MTEFSSFSSLEYAATGMALIPLIGFLSAWDANERFGGILRRQWRHLGRHLGRLLWPVVGLPLQIVLALAGIAASLGARLGVVLAGLAGLAICLWYQDGSEAAFRLAARARYYLTVKRGHRGGHRRALAA